MTRRAKHNGEVGTRRIGGFTLVEILTAMALAVLVMIGVVQVFKMTTDAVSEAEKLSHGYQLGRGTMNAIGHDVTRFTNEGYLAVFGNDIPVASYVGGRQINPPTKYRFDALAFTVVGLSREMESSVGKPLVGTAAEVVYSVGGRAEGAGGPVRTSEVISSTDEDPRGMLLVRKVFPTSGLPTMGGYGGTGLTIASAPTDAKSCLPLMAMDRWNDLTPKYRMAPPLQITTSSVPSHPQVNVVPTYDANDFPSYDSTVNLVVCDRVSEFVVEVLVRDWSGKAVWARPHITGASYKQALWCGNTRFAPPRIVMIKTNEGILTGTLVDRSLNIRQRCMPSMVRVTLVMHPYSDNRLLRQQPYVGDIPETFYKKYRGMVFRRTFRLNGVVNRASY
jgi:type II secretory pathway pseudopilin PulG